MPALFCLINSSKLKDKYFVGHKGQNNLKIFTFDNLGPKYFLEEIHVIVNE